jgi:hypothetical protein
LLTWNDRALDRGGLFLLTVPNSAAMACRLERSPLACRAARHHDRPVMQVSVSGRQFVFPRSCACCGRFPLTHLTVGGTEKNRLARVA